MMDVKQNLLQAKYARIIQRIADKLHIPLEDAMDGFYHSLTFQMIQNGVADMHCCGDIYLADEYCAEQKEKAEKEIQYGKMR
jgi:hypothetical protein